jgi:hypothetical protein
MNQWSESQNLENLYMSVGVMEDYKLRDLRSSHTLGWTEKRYPPTDGGDLRDFYHLDEFYFTTDEKKILENCRCIVPNFMND